MRKFRTFLLIGTLISLATPLPALAGGWVLLGERTVKFRSEKDTIRVGAKDGTFHKIQLKVKKSAVHLMDVKIHYANGEVQDVPIRALIKASGKTRVINLSGKNRVISKVTFRYRSPNLKRGKAEIQLFGKN